MDGPPAFGLKAAGAASLRIIMFLPFIRLQTGGCSRFMQVTETGTGLYIILLLKFPKMVELITDLKVSIYLSLSQRGG